MISGRYLKYTWDQIDSFALCVTQAVANNGHLVFNGRLAYTGVNQINLVDYVGYSRNLTFSSPDNLSAIQLHITGTQNGATIQETIAGPNANTVDTTNFFDTINSITISGGNVARISVGTGDKGAFKLIGSNSNALANISILYQIPNAQARYHIYYTTTDIAGNGKLYNDLIALNYLKSFSGAEVDANYYTLNEPYLYLYCSINSEVTAQDPIIDLIYYEPK